VLQKESVPTNLTGTLPHGSRRTPRRSCFDGRTWDRQIIRGPSALIWWTLRVAPQIVSLDSQRRKREEVHPIKIGWLALVSFSARTIAWAKK
jgi:hypothetical protein